MRKPGKHGKESRDSGMNDSECDDVIDECECSDEALSKIIAMTHEDAEFQFGFPYAMRRRLRKTSVKETREGRHHHIRYAGRGRQVPSSLSVIIDMGTERTKADLYEEARRCDIPGRSRMSKSELAIAIEAC